MKHRSRIRQEKLNLSGEAYIIHKEHILHQLNCNYDYENATKIANNAMKIANNAVKSEILNNEHKSQMHRLKIML